MNKEGVMSLNMWNKVEMKLKDKNECMGKVRVIEDLSMGMS